MNLTQIPQSLIAQYNDFLSNLSKEILKTINNDQAIQPLKQMEEPTFLLQRIQQIIKNVFDLNNQKTMLTLMDKVQDQSQRINNLLQQIQQMSAHSQINNIVQQEDKTQVKRTLTNKQILANKETIQIQTFQKQMIQRQQQDKYRIKQLYQTLDFIKNQHESQKNQYQSKILSSQQGIKTWQQKYKKIYQQKVNLQNYLERQIENTLELKLKIKDIQYQVDIQRDETQRLRVINQKIRSTNSQLQESNLILQKSNKKLCQQLQSSLNQLKILKSLPIPSQLTFPQQMQISPIQVNHLKQQIQKKTNTIQQLQKKLTHQKLIKHQIEMEYHQYKRKQQSIRFGLEQQIMECTIRLEKEVRINKQIHMKEIQDLRRLNQLQLNNRLTQQQIHYQQKLQLLQKIVDNKQQQLIDNKQQCKVKLDQAKQTYIQFQSTIRQYQTKNDQLKTILKDTQRNIVFKNGTNSELIKQYQKRIELCDEQVRKLKQSNQKLKRQYEIIRKDLQRQCLLRQLNEKQRSTCQKQNRLAIYSKSQFQQHLLTIQQQKHESQLLHQQIIHLQKQLSNINQKIQEQKLQNNHLVQERLKCKQKINKLEKANNQLKAKYQNYQAEKEREIKEIYRVHQMQITQNKKLLTSQFQQLLKNRQKKIQQISQQKELFQFKIKYKSIKQSVEKQRQENQKLAKKLQQYRAKTNQQKQTIQQQQLKQNELKQEIIRMQKLLKQQKCNNSQLIKSLKQQTWYYQSKFKQFKSEVYLSLKQVLDQIRQQQTQIKSQINKMVERFMQSFSEFYLMFLNKSTQMETKINHQINQIKYYYQHQVVLKLQVDKQQLIYQCQKKNKEKMIEMMTFVAGKQCQFKNLHEKYQIQTKKLEQLSTLHEQSTKDILKLKQQNLQFKQIIQKMNTKVITLQKQKISLTHDNTHIHNQNENLSKQLIILQKLYQQRLQKCRQKYIQQNQKLFNKYQRQFDNLIGMNMKSKNMGLSSLMRDIAPTKQSQKVLEKCQSTSKLDKLKKQILLQKKKLQLFDNTSPKSKIPTKGNKQLNFNNPTKY